MSIHDSLSIKYGLKYCPEDSQIKNWVSLTEYFDLAYPNKEMAGEQAAVQVFPDFKKKAYYFNAERIEVLLAIAKTRRNRLLVR